MKKKLFSPRERKWYLSLKTLLRMKLMAFLFFVSIFATTANSYSQQSRFDLNVSSVTIEDVINEIKSKSDLQFFFSNDDFDISRKVDLKVKNGSVDEILDQILESSEMSYKIVDNAVIISKAEVNPSVSNIQQSKSVTGKITDGNGDPLPGVTIVIKGTTQGTITDFDGIYSISEVPNGAVLVATFIGMRSQEVTINGRSSIDFTMEEEAIGLDEIIAIGYGVQKKSSLTGSISQVKNEDVSNRTITSAEQALQGKIAGVQIITTSGAPGSTPLIRVRGYSSNSDMSPLYVVDGITVSDISNIEPNDIESMEVLKDASAAAIYGAQAGNGVVLITTKKGKAGANEWGQISYDFQYSSQSVASTPNLMNASQYAEYMVDGGYFSQSTVDTYWDGVTNTDWINTMFKSSLMKKHSLSFSNGNDKSSFYTSLSYLDNNGIQVGDLDVYTRLTGMINADYKIKPWIKISTNNNIERGTTKNGGGSVLGDVFLMDPLTAQAYSESELPANMQSVLNSGWNILQNEDDEYYSISNFYGFNNPLASLNASLSKTQSINLTGNFATDLTPIKGLTITSKLGYVLGSTASNTYNHDYYGSPQRYSEFVTASQSNSTRVNYQWDNYVNYLTTIADKHDVSAMVGHSFIKNTYYNTNGGLTANEEDAVLKDDPELFGWLDFASSSASKTNSGRISENSSESYFGRVNYSYDSKYLLQFSLRADAFDLSKLPVTNRWGYFPAGSAAWVVSQENLWGAMPEKFKFSYLKLRASWGKNGSVGPLSNYLYATTMQSQGQYSYGNDSNYSYVSASYPASMGNDKLSWETSTQLDFGVDARFFDGKMSMTFDWFNKRTEDLLVTGLESSLIAGGNFSPINAGSVSNKGIELELGWDDMIGNDFRYGIHANASTLKNKVTYLDNSIDYIEGTRLLNDPITVFEEGSEVWHFYGYNFTGIDSATGEATFEDINDDGSITTEDRTNIGSAIPKLTYGVTLTAAYKGFDAIVFGTGVQGSQIFQALFSNDRAQGNRIYEEFYEDRWTTSNTDGIRPAASADISKYIVSSAMVKDGSFFKIKQIQLGYTVPENLLSKLNISTLRFYVSLDDWFTFTEYDGFDPEASSAGSGSRQGVDTAVYPISKKFVTGINLTF